MIDVQPFLLYMYVNPYVILCWPFPLLFEVVA